MWQLFKNAHSSGTDKNQSKERIIVRFQYFL